MTDFTGITCPVCGKPFNRTDDIVVCPECGAPYHRVCYKQIGHCIYEDKHGTSEAWKSPTRAKEAVRCPQCGHDNAPGTLFCEHCGKPLSQPGQDLPHRSPPSNPQRTSDSDKAPGPGTAPWFYGGQGPGAAPFAFDPMGGVDPEETIGGVKARDVAKAVQSNTTYYMPVFIRHERKHRNRFNGAAFLLTGAWMLYRKQYTLGTIITAVELALHFLWNYISAAFVLPVVYKAMEAAGSANPYMMTQEQTAAMYNQLAQMGPVEKLLFVLPVLLTFIILILHIVIGCVANRCYRKHCINLVQRIQAKTTEPGEALICYQERGGINSMLVFLVFICYLVLTNLPAWLVS